MQETSGIRRLIAAAGWAVPPRNVFVPEQPVVLMYHGVPRSDRRFDGNALETQLQFLKRHFDLVHWNERRKRSARTKVVLTFDDGLRNNFEVVAPLLRKYSAPAIFFVANRHSEPGKYLWFTYLAALNDSSFDETIQFRGKQYSLAAGSKKESLKRLRNDLLALDPHVSAMYEAIERELPPIEHFSTAEERRDRYEGMSAEEVAELARDPLFQIGGHTVDHPMLTKCESDEARKQIRENREWMERVTGKTCETFAYPSSDFDEKHPPMCAELGFATAFSVEKRVASPIELQVPRIGIYFSSNQELGFKVRWAPLVQMFQQRGLTPLATS